MSYSNYSRHSSTLNRENSKSTSKAQIQEAKIPKSSLTIFSRIIKRIKDDAFTQLKFNISKKRRNIVLPLLNRKFNRDLLQSAFLQLKKNTLEDHSVKIMNKIAESKTPTALLLATNRIWRQRKISALLKIKNQSMRIRKLANFAQLIFEGLEQILKNRTIQFMNKAKKQSLRKVRIAESITSIGRIQRKAIKRIKMRSFFELIQKSLKLIIQNQLNQKQQKLKQYNQAKVDKQKTVIELRQHLRSVQTTVSQSNFAKNKLKQDNKKQSKIQKIKLAQQIKNTQKDISRLELQQKKLEIIEDTKQKYYNRLQENLKKSKNAPETLRNLYQFVYNTQSDEIRNVDQLKKFMKFNQARIQNIDQFHIYENPRLKQEIRLYQGLNTTIQSKQYQRVLAQNQYVKRIIHVLAKKQFEPFINIPVDDSNVK